MRKNTYEIWKLNIERQKLRGCLEALIAKAIVSNSNVNIWLTNYCDCRIFCGLYKHPDFGTTGFSEGELQMLRNGRSVVIEILAAARRTARELAPLDDAVCLARCVQDVHDGKQSEHFHTIVALMDKQWAETDNVNGVPKLTRERNKATEEIG